MDGGDGANAGVAGRDDGEALEQVLGEVEEVLFAFGPGLGVALGDVDRAEPAELIGAGFVAALLGTLAEEVEVPLEEIDVEIGDAHVAKAAAGDQLDRFLAAGAGNPDGRMRLLYRTRPGIHVLQLPELAVMLERPRLGPGPQHEVHPFLKHGPGV